MTVDFSMSLDLAKKKMSLLINLLTVCKAKFMMTLTVLKNETQEKIFLKLFYLSILGWLAHNLFCKFKKSFISFSKTDDLQNCTLAYLTCL